MRKREERVMASLNILAKNGIDCEKQAAMSAISRLQSKIHHEPIRKKEKINPVEIKYCDSNHKEIVINCLLKVAPGSNLKEVNGRKIIIAELSLLEAKAAKQLYEYYWSAFQKETSRLLVAFIIKNDLVVENVADEEPLENDLNDISEIARYHDIIQPVVKKLNG